MAKTRGGAAGRGRGRGTRSGSAATTSPEHPQLEIPTELYVNDVEKGIEYILLINSAISLFICFM